MAANDTITVNGQSFSKENCQLARSLLQHFNSANNTATVNFIISELAGDLSNSTTYTLQNFDNAMAASKPEWAQEIANDPAKFEKVASDAFNKHQDQTAKMILG